MMKKFLSIILAFSMILTVITPAQATALNRSTEIDEEEEPLWTLVWSDEFDGNVPEQYSHRGLDLRTWEIQTGNGATMGLTGWGNGEIQYYHGDNVWVEDGMLHIEARLENRGSPGEGNWRHTSGRIRSVGTEGMGNGMSTRYGRIEASISLPYGEGLWPAFWMMPTYDVYGTWAASGEIDIMEARGRQPHISTSAIHYGGRWPNNTYSHASIDLRTIEPGLSINSFIQYAVEWEPGEMRFFVNDHLFWTVNEWHSLVHGQEDMGVQYMFPAPFDQDFHVLLNLAIGGWFDGGREPADSLFEESRLMRVEYLRVYEMTGRPMREPEREVMIPDAIPADAKPMVAPGGQIWDVNFENVVRTAPLPGDVGFPTREGWELFSGPFGGNITGYDIIDGLMHVQIGAAGGPVYANQLMQRVSLVRGRHYRLEFDAHAAAPRTINARMSQGANPGWTAYSNFNPSLTTQTQTFVHYFTMTQPTNVDARLEFNLGGSAHDIWIGNVSLVEVDYITEGGDVLITPLPNGNMVWNGTFNQGSDGMIFWNRVPDGATFNVTPQRQLEVSDITSSSNPLISQRRIPFANDTFGLSFEASGAGEIGFKVLDLAGNTVYYEYVTSLTQDMSKFELEFTLENVPYQNRELQIQFHFGGATSDVLLDNVRIERLTSYDRDFTGVTIHPMDNGDFFAGLRSWEPVNDSGGFGTVTVNDGVATTAVTALGVNPWSVILMNNGQQVQSGFRYAVEFDVSASVPRNIQLVVETAAFHRRLQPVVPVTTETVRHRFEFTSAHTEILDVKFLMGAMEGAQLGDVNISNVEFFVVDAPYERIPTFIPDTTSNFVGNDIELRYNSATSVVFNEADVSVFVNGMRAQTTREEGRIVIDGSIFRTSTAHRIEIVADGFETLSFVQVMRDSDIPYIPRTGLLINGNFTEALTGPEGGWWYEGQQSALFRANWYYWFEADYRQIDGGGIAVDLPNAGYAIWHAFIHQQLEERLPVGTYQLTFDARATRNRDIVLEFGTAPSGLQQQNTVALTSEWQTFTIELTSADFVRFLLGNPIPGVPNHSVYINNVHLEEVVEVIDDGNLLLNGNFELPMTGPDGGWWYTGQERPLFTADWFAWLRASYRVLPTGGIAVDMPNGGYAAWHVFLNQELPATLPVGEYQLTFEARSTRDRYIIVEFGAGALQQQTRIDLTDEMQTFTINVPTASRVRFLLGHTEVGEHNHTVYLQNVLLVDLTEDPELVCLIALEELIERIESLNIDLTRFSPESVAVFTSVLEIILDSEFDTQEEVNVAFELLYYALISLVVIITDGNEIINGDFDLPFIGANTGWWYAGQNSPLFTAEWYSWFDATYRLPVDGGIAIDLGNPGYLDWHAFLGQDLPNSLSGNYELTFNARSTVDRDIWIDFDHYPSPLQQQAVISLTDEWEEFTVVVTGAEMVRFLLGWPGGNGPSHSVYINNVRLVEVAEIEDSVFTLRDFNNGNSDNASLANAQLIRIWTQLDGTNSFIRYEDLTVTAELPNGNCAMHLVTVNRPWNNQDYVNFIDVTKNAVWTMMTLTVTFRDQTIVLPLYNDIGIFGLQAFNNGNSNNESLANAGVIRVWKQFNQVNTLKYYHDLTITATLPNGDCAMHYVRINRIWNNLDYTNFLDVQKADANWSTMELSVTWLNQTVTKTLINDLYGALAYVVESIPTARVNQLSGNENELIVTVTQILSDGTTNVIEVTQRIRNNSDVTVVVGDYNVFVSTRGNTQIREIFIVN